MTRPYYGKAPRIRLSVLSDDERATLLATLPALRGRGYVTPYQAERAVEHFGDRHAISQKLAQEAVRVGAGKFG